MNTKLELGSKGVEVRVIQGWLAELGYGKLDYVASATGVFDLGTYNAVRQFQHDNQLGADGIIGPNTWWKLLDTMRWHSYHRPPTDSWGSIISPPGTPRWLANFAMRPTGFANWRFNLNTFNDLHVEFFGRVAPPGLHVLLDYLTRDTNVSDVRWAAYALATVHAECGPTRTNPAFAPVEEGLALRQNKAHNDLKTAPDGSQHRYYGRGYVQLTWIWNYERVTEGLGLAGNNHLVNHPERALDRDLGYAVLSYTMRRGLYEGPRSALINGPREALMVGWRLSDFISHKQCDYLNARRVINLMDRAEEIQGYAKKYDLCLTGSFP